MTEPREKSCRRREHGPPDDIDLDVAGAGPAAAHRGGRGEPVAGQHTVQRLADRRLADERLPVPRVSEVVELRR